MELYSQGNLSRILPILHGIGHYTDLEPLLKNDYSPLSVLKKALQQWFAGMLPKEIEQALDFEVDFITEPDNQGCSDLEFDSDEDDYVLLQHLQMDHASIRSANSPRGKVILFFLLIGIITAILLAGICIATL